MRPRLLTASLSGAAGTLSAMGTEGPEIRAALARQLDLADPGASWHSERDRIGEYAGWLTLVLGSLGKMAEDLLILTQSGLGEVKLGSGGGSSTMPQKVNPVLPSLIAALARHGAGLNLTLQHAAAHRQQRDGAAWFTEWLTLPELTLCAARALTAAAELSETLAPVPERLAAVLDDGTGLIHAEALSFALARRMPRPEAQTQVKALCKIVRAEGGHLLDRAHKLWTDLGFDPGESLGTAPAEARAFAERASQV
jgi:3-carboxy-cis,cis-muconate cycloisomerase